jgi:hypothetical protein
MLNISAFYLDKQKSFIPKKKIEVYHVPQIALISAKRWQLKVRKFQNENMESSRCPKYERKIWKFLPWTLWAEFFKFFCSYFGQCDDFIFSFWNLLTFNIPHPRLCSKASPIPPVLIYIVSWLRLLITQMQWLRQVKWVKMAGGFCRENCDKWSK